jgi:hypothetical protein
VNDDKSVNAMKEGSDRTDIQHYEIQNDNDSRSDHVSDDGYIDSVL